MKRQGIISVYLKYDIPEGENAEAYCQEVELPKEYVEDTYEFVREITGNDLECY